MTVSPLALPSVSPDLEAALLGGLDRVDDRLREVVDHDDDFIAVASRHLLAAGGKRFRPMLVLLAAQVGRPGDLAGDDVVEAATGVELTHLASLYHDDVMDDADVRRGVPSVNAAYDNSTAILVGDLLFGKASEIVAGLGAEAVLIQARTFVRLCSGQIRDDRPCPAGVDPVDYYLGVLRDKTGVLVATSAQYGAMFSGCSPEVVELLREYGERLGVAFQLADDLIDIASDGDQSGKTPGTDLREGVDTLAVLLAKASTSTDADSVRLRELLAGDLSSEEAALEETLELLRRSPSLVEARRRTVQVGREAAALLDVLPDSDAKSALVALVTSVVDRVA